MAHDPYAPKRNPAAEIVDLNRPLPKFFNRSGPKGAPAMFNPAPTVESELAGYIDGEPPYGTGPVMPTIRELQAAEHAQQPEPPADPTDKQYVAINIDRLRHLDLKAVVAEMFGETLPTSAAEIADKMATWAAANNPRAAA